jgi:hypothetical protein
MGIFRAETPTMTTGDLKTLLDDVPDTFEIVLRHDSGWSPVLHAWHDARNETAAALQRWRSSPGNGDVYAVYRAAQDREDAAQDALAQTQTSLTSVS